MYQIMEILRSLITLCEDREARRILDRAFIDLQNYILKNLPEPLPEERELYKHNRVGAIQVYNRRINGHIVLSKYKLERSQT
jgi:hypothetical protein